MSRTKRRDPIIIQAKFQSRCAETGKVINRGESCIYYPGSKRVFHMESKQSQTFREQQFDQQHLDYQNRNIDW